MKASLINSVENHASIMFALFVILTAILTYISVIIK